MSSGENPLLRRWWHQDEPARTDNSIFKHLRGLYELEVDLQRYTWEELAELVRGERFLPEEVASFLSIYTETQQPTRVLNLWSADGALASRLLATLPDASLIAVDPDRRTIAVARHLNPSDSIRWVLAHPSEMCHHEDPEIDLIISTPPFDTRQVSFDVRQVAGSTISVKDEEGRIDLLRHAPALSADGAALLITTNSILWSHKPTKFLDALESQGLWMQAAISLPAGTFAPFTSISSVIAIFSRKPTDDVFLAELPRDPGAQMKLVDNMLNRRTGRAPEAGILQPRDQLAPLENLAARFDLDKTIAATGVPIMTLEQVSLEFRPPQQKDGRLSFQSKENCLYLCRVGSGPVLDHMPDKVTRDWVQIPLDPNVAVASYVAKSMSGPIGTLSRRSLTLGTVPRIPKSYLSEIRVPIPSTPEQFEALRLDRELQAFEDDITETRAGIWLRPHTLPAIATKTDQLIPRDELESWFDNLPMPLSTVGRAYYARSRPREQVDALFNLFEATAEFHTTILLSGLAADGTYLAQNREALLGTRDDRRTYYEKPNLGSWTILGSRLAKHVRRILSGGGQKDEIGRETIIRWFGRPQPQWLEAMASSDLYSALDRARALRNDDRHGGATSESTTRSQLAALEAVLTDIRTSIADSWAGTELVLPTNHMQYTRGTFEATVEVLMGNSLPLRQKTVETVEPIQQDYIHIVFPASRSALRLLPLVRMMPSPKTSNNACYFYNRLDKGGVRYVSYYYEEDPETHVASTEPGTMDVLSVLGLDDTNP